MNPLQATFRPSYDIFISELNAAGSNLVYSTYLGGISAGNEAGNAIAVNAAGEIAVVGDVDSSDFPVVNPLQAFTEAPWMPSWSSWLLQGLQQITLPISVVEVASTGRAWPLTMTALFTPRA